MKREAEEVGYRMPEAAHRDYDAERGIPELIVFLGTVWAACGVILGLSAE